MAEPESVTEEALKKLADQLECSICLDSFTDPKVLQCFHVFCKDCLEPLLLDDQRGPSLRCPTCRQSTVLPARGVSGLQSAFHIHHLFEIEESLRKVKQRLGCKVQKTQCEKCKRRQASGFCRDCDKFVCEACIEIHESWEEFSGHKVIGLEQLQIDETEMVHPKEKKPIYCSEHPDKLLDLFCETDLELICQYCIATSHQGHQFNLIGDAFPKHRDTIAKHIEPVKQHLSIVNKAIEGLNRTIDDITTQRAELEADIQRKIGQLHEALEVRKTELIGQLDQMTQLKLKTLSTQKDELELSQTRLDSCLQFVSDSLKMGSEGEILAMEKKVVQQVKGLCTEYDPNKLHPLDSADIAFTVTNELLAECQQFGNVYEELVCPEKCYAMQRRSTSLTVGVVNEVTLRTVDTKGSRYTKPLPDGSISCELVSCSTAERIDCRVRPSKAGKYAISYTPTCRGRHELHIKISDQHIEGSPYTMMARGGLDAPIRTITGLKGPWGVATNERGEIVVAEQEGHCISIYYPNGRRVRSFGQKGSALGQFSSLNGVAVDRAGNIIAVEGGKCHVQVFKADGTVLALLTKSSGLGELADPVGICVSPLSGKVYICDRSSHRVHILHPDLTFSSSFGSKGSGVGQFKYPWGVAVDNQGNVYVADSENHRIQAFSEDGNFLHMFGAKGKEHGELNFPISIAIDSEDVIYVAEKEKHCVSLYTTRGDFLGLFGTRGKGPGQFSYPCGVTVDRDGLVYVSDYGNNRLQIW